MPYTNWNTFIATAQSGEQVVSFPTDTVPALACHPNAAELLFKIKQRSLEKSLVLMAASASDLWPYVTGADEERAVWIRMSEQYWPGALTLVLPASDLVPTRLNPQTPESIGIRVPASPIAQAVLAETGPLATTSANRSGQPALQTFREIENDFPNIYILEPEALPEYKQELLKAKEAPIGSGVASTVAKWNHGQWQILRSGAVALNIA